LPRRTLITGGWVITCDQALGDIQNGDILIDAGKIIAVGSKISAGDADVIDASGMVVIPGLVDTHRHTWQTCVRHTCADIPALEYFDLMMGRRGPRYRPEDVYMGNLVGALTALEGGVTTLLDWSHIQNSPEHTDAAIAALKDAGIRAVFGHGVPAPRPGVNRRAPPHPHDIRRVRRDLLASDDALITLAMAARGPELADDGIWQADLVMARELGIRTTIHMGAFAFNGAKAAITQMWKFGLLGPDLTFVHCCTCADEEFRMMADHGVTASLGVQVEQNMEGIGDIPIDRLLAEGIEPSLSCDTETCGAGDMFTVMRQTLASYRSRGGAARKPGAPAKLSTRDVLRFATRAGAQANGLGHRVGSLTVGKAADIVLLRGTDMNLTPVCDPVAAIVLAAHPGNVDTVLVNGRTVKRGGKLLSIDLEVVRARALASQEYILQWDEQDGGTTAWSWTGNAPLAENRH
jgi:5-methylthioadenosine/S-adenosylhomocysteine deaminase